MSDSTRAIISKKRPISRIWIVPITAALIGLWMIYQYLNDQGVTITISMPNAQGVSAGKTLIKTRSVPIGMVSEVRLADNLEHVIVAIEIEKPYLDLLTNDALIWAVQPRIDETGITGLNTILSGIYFELQPGKSDSFSDSFELLPTPPLISQNVEGRRYQLFSNTAEVLHVGAPIIFKGFKVGSIENARFDWYSETMHYQIFIEAPNYNLVTDNSLFWVESGIELDLSADGINFKTGSLTKLLGGAITFGRPDREPKGDIAPEGERFALSSSFKEGLEARYDDFQYYVVTLDQSVRGLKPGAPVEYRGVRIGTVVEVPALLDSDGTPHFMTAAAKLIPVLIKIEYQRIYRDKEIARRFWESNIDQWIREGLRMSLQTGNLLTGGLFLQLDFYPDEAQDHYEIISTYRVIPGTSSGGLSQLSAQMSDFLNKLNNLELNKTLDNIDTTLSNYASLAERADSLMRSTQSENIPAEFGQSLKELQETLKAFQSDSPLYADIQQSMQAIDELGQSFQQDAPLYEDLRLSLKAIKQLTRDFQNGAPVYEDIRRSLQGIEQITNELQPFTRSLNEHPNILIFDKSPAEDIQPQRGSNYE